MSLSSPPEVMDFGKIASRVVKRLPIIAQQQAQGQGEQGEEESGEETFGGKGPFSLPADHVAAIQVPKGGACCEKCTFVDAEAHACNEPNYVAWNGGDPSLPDLPLDEICSDWFKAGAAAGEAEEEPAEQA